MLWSESLYPKIERFWKLFSFGIAGKNIIIWAGHGSAVFFPLSTLERIFKAAPNHLIGFVFAEMEGTSPHMQEVVEKIILPFAELCKQHKKNIIFRNKNIFWNGTCYMPFWKNVLLNERYKDVFVPGLEETNCRSQELSLAGRIGLWQSGFFDSWACRTVTDNANFDRMFEWGAQQVITHHLRNLISSASMGADYFFSDIHGGSNTKELYNQLLQFYKMIEKGIIHIPEKDELLSLSDFGLEMKTPPAANYIKHGTNGHKYWYNTEGKTEMVFDKLDAYWGGSTLDEHDYSSYAMNVKRRMTNFLPELPYGLTPIIPTKNSSNQFFKNTIVTDGEFFYDKNGKQFSALEYKPIVEKALKDAANRLPVIVKGNVHWSAVKLDKEHIRITLIDPGYVNPADRVAEIVIQHIQAERCTDILSNEELQIKSNSINLTVPAGVFRIVDIKINVN